MEKMLEKGEFEE